MQLSLTIPLFFVLVFFSLSSTYITQSSAPICTREKDKLASKQTEGQATN